MNISWYNSFCLPGWRNGRRTGLKILRTQVRAGSNPALGTSNAPIQIAGWSSTAARRAHNPKVTGSNPVPATISGAVAQLARAFGSYPTGHRFKSSQRHQNITRERTLLPDPLVISRGFFFCIKDNCQYFLLMIFYIQ